MGFTTIGMLKHQIQNGGYLLEEMKRGSGRGLGRGTQRALTEYVL